MTRFYVSLTWEDWPDGGSYGTVVVAENQDLAVQIARAEMAVARAEERELCYHCGDPTDDGEGFDGLCGSCADYADETGDELEATEVGASDILKEFQDSWHLVDCFDLDEFIKTHSKPEAAS